MRPPTPASPTATCSAARRRCRGATAWPAPKARQCARSSSTTSSPRPTHRWRAVAFRWDWDWPTAEREFTRAIQLNPGAAPVRPAHVLLLAAMARCPEALAEMTCACELDPLSLVAGTGLGRVLDFSGRHDDAIEQYRRTLAIDTHAEAHFDLAMALAHVGRLAEALSAGSTAAALAPDSIVYAENVA